MSGEAIRRVLNELEGLQDRDQELVLRFLKELRQLRGGNTLPGPSEDNPALEGKDGLLVFTGKIMSSETDWLRVVRDEREKELTKLVSGNTAAE